jgi:hypothetical protein
MKDVYQNYLFDLGFELVEIAKAARDKRNSAEAGSTSREFHSGRTMAYIEVLCLMQQEARTFEIPLDSLRLDNINPERDLLK